MTEGIRSGFRRRLGRVRLCRPILLAALCAAPAFAEPGAAAGDAAPLAVESAVARALEGDMVTAPYELRARVEGGAVVLRGAVAAAFERDRASRVAAGVAPDHWIENRIAVRRELADDDEGAAAVAPPAPRDPLPGYESVLEPLFEPSPDPVLDP